MFNQKDRFLGVFNRYLVYDYAVRMQNAASAALPALFSAGNFNERDPTQKQIENASLLARTRASNRLLIERLQSSFEFYVKGHGWEADVAEADQRQAEPTKTYTICVRGPDPGYISAARCALAAALSLAEDSSTISGVLAPMMAFQDTRIYDRLNHLSITFRVTD